MHVPSGDGSHGGAREAAHAWHQHAKVCALIANKHLVVLVLDRRHNSLGERCGLQNGAHAALDLSPSCSQPRLAEFDEDRVVDHADRVPVQAGLRRVNAATAACVEYPLVRRAGDQPPVKPAL